jgi:flavodoxin
MKKKHKVLVVFYSRTGITKKIALELPKLLKADVDEIIDEKNRAGALGYIIAGKDAMTKKLTKIKIRKNPKDYDLVIIGTPNWGGNIAPAVRTYLTGNKLKKVAFFCTHGGESEGKTFQELELLSKKPLATLSLKTKEVVQDNYNEQVIQFYRQLV